MTLRLAITAGEPAGIGPDLCIQIAQQVHAHELVVIADPQLLQQRAAQLGLPLSIRCYNDAEPARPLKPSSAGTFCWLNNAARPTLVQKTSVIRCVICCTAAVLKKNCPSGCVKSAPKPMWKSRTVHDPASCHYRR